jgi:ribose/xylose/arabinose/galactoside ABC-type transport system permease subunit
MGKIAALRTHGILIGLFVLCTVFAIFNPVFASADNLLNILVQSTPIALASLGMTFVVLVGGIDLSVGSLVALSGIVLGLLTHSSVPLVLSVPLCLLTGAACGTLNGVLTAKARIPSFIVTLGMMSIARGLALLLTDGRSISGFPQGLATFARGSAFGLPFPALLLLLVVIGAWFFQNFMVGGRHLYAIGGNAKAAWFSGVQVPAYIVFVFTLNGFFAAAASIVVTARLDSAHPLAGSLYELDAIAAVVIGGGSLLGGRGSAVGTLCGAMVLAVMKNGLSILNVNAYIQQILVGVLITVTVALDTLARKDHEGS